MAEVSSTRNPGRDVAILIFFLIALGIFWFAQGGPEKAAQNPPKPFLNSTTAGFSSAGNTGTYSQSGSESGSDSTSYYPPPITVSSLYEQLGIGEDFESSVEESEISEYQGRVTLTAGQARWSDPDGEYIEIRASYGGGGVNIGGWTVEGKQKLKLKIPQATHLYLSNTVNREEDIVLGPGERIILTTGRSPVGDSFLVNKCSGYFSQHQTFTPSLYSQCPFPKDEDWPLSLSDDCLDYIDTLPRCRANFSHPLYTENSCIEAINNALNYMGCVDFHKNDDDFYKKEWRVYLGREEEMWKDRRETIILRDDKGKIVDEISYK